MVPEMLRGTNLTPHNELSNERVSLQVNSHVNYNFTCTHKSEDEWAERVDGGCAAFGTSGGYGVIDKWRRVGKPHLEQRAGGYSVLCLLAIKR